MHDIDFSEEKEIKFHIKKFLLYPKFWMDKDNQLPAILKWKGKKFTVQNKNDIPSAKGVYAFILKPYYPQFPKTQYLFYVGKTTRTLKIRYHEYLSEMEGKGKPRYKIKKMLNTYKDCMYFMYTEIEEDEKISRCEEKLLNAFVPHVNTAIPKAKIKPELMYIYE